MKNLSLLLLASAFAYGCSTPCEQAGDRVAAKYEECGMEIDESTEEDAEEVECTDTLAEQSECSADCIEAADCGVITMENTDYTSEEWTSYTECVTACM